MSTTQPNLFTPDAYGGAVAAKTLAGAADPPTSHEAAAQAAGKLARHAQIVLALLKAHPGSTWRELYEAANDADRDELKEPQQVLRRLDTLKKAGLARDGEARACRVKWTTARVWFPN